MNAKTHSGNLPSQNQHAEAKNAKQKVKKEAIVNRLTCATLEGVHLLKKLGEQSQI